MRRILTAALLIIPSLCFSQYNTCNDINIVGDFYSRIVPSEGTTVNYMIPDVYNKPSVEERLLAEPWLLQRDNLWVYDHRRKTYETAILDIVCLTDYRPEQIKAMQLASLEASPIKRTVLYDALLPIYVNSNLGDNITLEQFSTYYNTTVDLADLLDKTRQIIDLPVIADDYPDYVQEFFKDPNYQIPVSEFKELRECLKSLEGVLQWISYIDAIASLSQNLGDFVITSLIKQMMANQFALKRFEELKVLLHNDSYYQDQALFDALENVEALLDEGNNDEKALAFLNSIFDNRSAILQNVDAIATLCGVSYLGHLTNLIAGSSIPTIGGYWMIGVMALHQEFKIILNLADQYDHAEQAIILSTLAYRICANNQNTECDFQKMSLYGYTQCFYHVIESFSNPPIPFLWELFSDWDEVVNNYEQNLSYTSSVLDTYIDCDDISPTVVGLSHGEEVNTDFLIIFSENMNPATIVPANVVVYGSQSGTHQCQLSYASQSFVLTINPETDFQKGESVEITLNSGIKDANGNSLDGDADGLPGPGFTFNTTISGVVSVSTIDLTCNDTNPELGEKLILSATVKDGTGNAIEGESITFTHTNAGAFSGSNPAISDENGIAVISYTPSANGDHKLTATSSNGKYDSFVITIGGSAFPPTITLTYPNNEVCHDECVIAWSAYDPDNNPAIYLHYDTDNSGYDGTCINPGNPIYKDVASAYMWNTASMTEGVYWVYATINDGTNEARDYSPGYIEIKHPELSADFDYSSRSIDEDEGDGDQIIESGEFFELEIRIRNEGTEAYYQVNAILTSGNSNISITDDDSYYGEFAPGVAKWGENDFYVRVNQGYVGNVDFDLSITFKDAEGYEYYQVIDIPDIYVSNNVSPGFAVEGIEIVDDGSKCNNDGILQSGENSIQYRLLLRNSGTGNAIDVYCNAQALPEGFDTGINGAGYPDIAAGTAQWPDIDDNYYLREIPYDYSGTLNAELMVTWADGEFNQLVPFSFDVHPAPRLRYFPETTDFGIQPVGGTAVIPITLTNYGSADIVVTQIEDISANPDNSITGVTFPLTINPSGSVVINFNISRSSPQNVNEAFRIHSNNHIVSTQDILISGTFYNPQPQGYKKLWESPGEILPVDLDDCKWIEPGDFDNDGLIEVVMYRTNMVHFWEQTSAHSFEFEYKYTFTVPGVDPRIFSLKAGNCDGDNKLDIVIKHTDQGVEPMTAALRILEASGDDIYSQVWSTSISYANIDQLEVGNCDSDVYDEIIIGTVLADDALVVYNRTGDNTYQATWNSGATIGNYCSYIGHITTGDTDKDGRNEIILIGHDEYIFIWEYNGSYSLAHDPLVTSTTFPDWGDNVYPLVSDVDNDNKNEIILTAGADDYWKFVVFNPDTWSIAFSNSPGLYGDLNSSTVADMNGNGIPEIFFGEDEAPYRLIAYEYIDGSFFEIYTYPTGNGDEVINIRPYDLNADGVPELVLSNDDRFMVWGYEEVPLLPDLQIAANNFTFSPEEVTDAEEINIIATIYNIGTDTATDIPVEFYLTHPDNGNRIDSLNIQNIAPSGSQPLTINWNLFQTGNFDIYVVIDRLNAIDELTEDNNIQAKTISIIDNDTIPPIISNNTHSEFYGDDDGLIEDNEYINISWNIVDESGVNSSYVLLNDLQTITAMPSGGNSYYAVLTNQSPGLLPYEIHATDNDNSALLSVVRDTILILKHAPDVTSKLPENGAVDVPLDTEILAFFDLSLDATTINSNTVLLSESATGIPIAPLSVTWSPELNRVSFIPSKLEYSTGYTIRLVSGPSGIADINGNTLEADYSWTFTTISEPLDADFMVSDQNPEVGESISFLDISSGNPISWLWDFGDGSTSNEQNPTYFYSTSGTFTVTLTINDQSGNDFETKESFITAVQTLQSPTVTTATLDNIAIYAAQGGGTVTNDGGSSITARGVCWSTSPGPTVEYSTYTVDGAGTGEFSSSITGITPGTTYYLRAYAKNAIGTGYGDEIIFTTYNADAIQDADGNYYNILALGTQIWMAGNLKTTSYNDGTTIPHVTDPATWQTMTTPAYAWYDNDEATNKDIYGALYNWHTVNTGKLCPYGWHVPDDEEWKTLEMFLGMSQSQADAFGIRMTENEGGKLKETGFTHWLNPNTGATNVTGFTALPGGNRDISGTFYLKSYMALWWSSSLNASTIPIYRSLYYNEGGIERAGSNTKDGLSIRCIKDNTAQQSITLLGGWNILSFAAMPSDMTMSSVVQPLISDEHLDKVQDQKGRAIEWLNENIGWVDEIGEMNPAEGYKIRVSENTSLSVAGQSVLLPFDILLESGWNIIGYPSMSLQSAASVLGSLIASGALLKVQDENGAAIEQMIGGEWHFGFENFEPGEGYMIKTNTYALLTLTSGTKGKILDTDKTQIKPVHFTPSYSGNGLDHMNIYIEKPEAGKTRLSIGDEVALYDGDVCVGASVVSELAGRYISIITSFDDPVTMYKDGFDEGNAMSIRLWDAEAGEEIIIDKIEVIKGKGLTFERMGTLVLKAEFERAVESCLGNAYPNPSNDKTTFTFSLAEESYVHFEIFDLKGEKVKILVNQVLPAGNYEIEWDNKTESGNKVKGGAYFYSLRLNHFTNTKQLVVH